MELIPLKLCLKKKAVYTLIADPYMRFLKTLRSFQHAAHEACKLEVDKGRIIAPCGCGKTCIQEAWHVGNMLQKSLHQKSGVYVIASHRLILNNQLLGRILSLAIECGIPLDVAYVGSMQVNLSTYYTKYAKLGYTPDVSRHLVSTSSAEIEGFVAAARERNQNTLIVSTYDSFDLLEGIGIINQCSFDEAHNTIEQGFTANIAKVMSHILKSRFFTATPNSRMETVEKYGECLYDYPPHKACEDGEICCPRIHVVDSVDPDKTTSDTNVGMLVRNLIEAYQKHSEYVAKYSIDASQVAPKLLVSASSIHEMMAIYNSETFRQFVKDRNITTAAISSPTGGGGCFFNGEKQSRSSFMQMLGKLTNQEPAIIFNVDILTEGFDLPSITGVMPLRNMNASKILQLLGRCLRLHPEDRIRLYSGDMLPCDYAKYIKPYGYIVISRHLVAVNEHAEMISCIRAIINAYKTPAEQVVVQERYWGQNNNLLPSVIPPDPYAGRSFDLEHDTIDVVAEINKEMFADKIDGMKLDDKKAYLDRMTEELGQ